MKHIIRLKQHHEKSIEILEAIERAQRQIDAHNHTIRYMDKNFLGVWDDRDNKLERIKVYQAVKERLESYYTRLQIKAYKMLQLGQVLMPAASESVLERGREVLTEMGGAA